MNDMETNYYNNIITKKYIRKINIVKFSQFDTWVEIMKPCKSHNVSPTQYLNILKNYIRDNPTDFDPFVINWFDIGYASRYKIISEDNCPKTRKKIPLSNETRNVILRMMNQYNFPKYAYFFGLCADKYMQEDLIKLSTPKGGHKHYRFSITNLTVRFNKLDNYPTLKYYSSLAIKDDLIISIFNKYQELIIALKPSTSVDYQYNKCKDSIITTLCMYGYKDTKLYEVINEYGTMMLRHFTTLDPLFPIVLLLLKYDKCDVRVFLSTRNYDVLERYVSFETSGKHMEFGNYYSDIIEPRYISRMMDLVELNQLDDVKSKKDEYYRNIDDESLQIFIKYLDMGEKGFCNYILCQKDFSVVPVRNLCGNMRRRYPELYQYINILDVWSDRVLSKYKGICARKDKNVVKEQQKIVADGIKSIIGEFLLTDETDFDKYCEIMGIEIKSSDISLFKEYHPDIYEMFRGRIDSDPNSGYNRSKQAFVARMKFINSVIDAMLDHEVSITEYYQLTRIDPDEIVNMLIRKTIVLPTDDIRTVRVNLATIKKKHVALNINAEYSSSSNIAGHEVTLEEKRAVVSTMHQLNLPLYRPIYLCLLRDYIKEGNFDKYVNFRKDVE